MNTNIPGSTPLWIILFNSHDPSENPAQNCQFINAPKQSVSDIAKQCVTEAEKIREELVNLKDVVDQFKDFLKRFKKEI
jgi:hypothetical protein